MYVPRRYIVGVLGFFGLIVSYTLRMALNVAILPIMDEKKDSWDEGIVLSAFYWGYIVTQLPGGTLSIKYGPKLIYGWGFAWASIFTIIWPFCTFNFTLAVAVRILTGIGEGVTFPALYQLLALWYPRTEKSTWTSAMGVAPTVGTVIANGLSPVVINLWGWESIFYLAGGMGIVWALVWFLCVTDSPSDMKSVSCVPIKNEEVLYIIDNQDKLRESNTDSVSYLKIFKEPAFLVLAMNHFAYNWGYYVFASWLPTYLKKKLKFDLDSAGFISILPYIIMPFVGIPSGYLVDKLVKAQIVSLLTLRKFFQTLGTLLPATFLIILSFWPNPSPVQAVVIMCMALCSAPFSTAAFTCNFIDISTKHAGVLFSITNTFATLPGIVGVYLTGFILQQTNDNWAIVFLIAAGIYLFGMVVWNVWAKVEQIDFDADVPYSAQDLSYSINKVKSFDN